MASLSPEWQYLSDLKLAANYLRNLSSDLKNKVLHDLQIWLEKNDALILAANHKDLAELDKVAHEPAFRDRLLLNEKRLAGAISSIEEVIKQNDPVGKVAEQGQLTNGLQIKKVCSPLGVVLFIFESRPNVLLEAFPLCFKSGNALLFKPGKESVHTCQVLWQGIKEVLKQNNVLHTVIYGLLQNDRTHLTQLLKQSQYVDLVIPRGGEKLIAWVVEESRIPILKNDRGMCHIYVHHQAHFEMANNIIINAKTQRPGVCNAMETLLVDESIAGPFLSQLLPLLKSQNVELFVCPKTQALQLNYTSSQAANPQSFDTEYLDLKMNIKVVANTEEALAHIAQHGSRHSEAIITQNKEVAQKFLRDVDCAAAYWNASTRFTDGYCLGLGAEMGISTQKLHARGPVGLRELTSLRWVIEGTGQIRT